MPLPKLSFLLTAMNISTIYSAHGDRIGSAPITCKFQMGELHMEITVIPTIVLVCTILLCCQIALAFTL